MNIDIWIVDKLTILTGTNCVLLNSVQEFIEIEAWFLLTFSICLHNQLSSNIPLSRIQDCMFEKDDSLNRQKVKGCSFRQVLR